MSTIGMNDNVALPISPAAERMRRHRRRRRNGLRCITVQLREREIDALVRKGSLNPEMRNNTDAIKTAIHAIFEQLFR
jgi:hypothetical protein